MLAEFEVRSPDEGARTLYWRIQAPHSDPDARGHGARRRGGRSSPWPGGCRCRSARRRSRARDVRLEDARDLPRVANHLERDVVVPTEALPQQLEHLRRLLEPPGRPELAVLEHRDPAEVAVDVQRSSSHLVLLRQIDRETKGGRHRRIRVAAQRISRSCGYLKRPGSKRTSNKRLPCSRSSKGPCPNRRTYVRRRMSGIFGAQFMPRRAGVHVAAVLGALA